MADIDPAGRVCQPSRVYRTADGQEVHILDGGANPQNPQPNHGHGHAIYNIPQGFLGQDRPPL
jgi:hypothetical protein